jgi:hypothetical protein
MKTLEQILDRTLKIPMSVTRYLSDIGRAQGVQDLYTRHSPQRLKVLREHAIAQSAVSSNRIEGVEIDQARVGTVVFGHPALKDRDEEEVAGYRDALNLIHTQGAALPVSEETILQLHKQSRGNVWDAGIKTNLLFFTKGEPTKTVWYYEHPYPPGVKNYNKTRPIAVEEFKPEKDWWCKDTAAGCARRKETPFAWQVTLDEIKARNYNLDIKNPNAEAAKHGDPDELLADYKKLLIEVAAARDALRDELAKALESAK